MAAGIVYERSKRPDAGTGWRTAAAVWAASPVLIDRRPTDPASSPSHLPSSLTPSYDSGSQVISSPAAGDSLPWNKGARVQQIMRHGYPSLDSIRTYDNFVLSYDRRNRTANWVLEHLSPELLSASTAGKTGASAASSSGSSSSLTSSSAGAAASGVGKSPDRSFSSFFEDESLHPYFRSRNEDYRSSGYDRGHLAAAGNHKISQSIMDQTFVLSNISPQVGKGFNRDVWNDLEQYVRYRARKARNLWVCTGPLYLPRHESDGRTYVRFEVIGKNQVSVPTHFFKALVVENTDGSVDLESYVMANAPLDPNVPLRAYQVPIDSIERAAGFLLFHEVPRHAFTRVNGSNPVLEKFQSSLAADRIKRLASRKN